MKLAIAAILVASVIALSGLAAADLSETQGVTATGTVSEELDFTVDESTLGITLSPDIYPDGAEANGNADLFTTGDWQIAGTVSGKMSNVDHELSADLVYTITDASGAAGTFTPVTYYFQDFTSGDYAGTYTATVTWTASAAF